MTKAVSFIVVGPSSGNDPNALLSPGYDDSEYFTIRLPDRYKSQFAALLPSISNEEMTATENARCTCKRNSMVLLIDRILERVPLELERSDHERILRSLRPFAAAVLPSNRIGAFRSYVK